MVRVGIVGCGKHTHTAVWATMINRPANEPRKTGMKVESVWSSHRQDAEEVAAKCGGVHVADTVEEVVERVDAAIIGDVDFRKYPELVRPFFEAKKPAYVNRPFASTLEDARTMVALAEASGAALMTGSCMAYSNEVQNRLKPLLQKLGHLRHYWVAGSSQNFSSYAPHVVDICFELFGAPQRVCSHGTYTNDFTYSERPGIGLIVFEHAPGEDGHRAVGMGLLSWGIPDMWFEVRAYGSEGRAEEPIRSKGQDDLWMPVLWEMERMFLTAEQPHTGEQILRRHRVLLAAHKSFVTGRAVNLEDVADHALPFEEQFVTPKTK